MTPAVIARLVRRRPTTAPAAPTATPAPTGPHRPVVVSELGAALDRLAGAPTPPDGDRSAPAAPGSLLGRALDAAGSDPDAPRPPRPLPTDTMADHGP